MSIATINFIPRQNHDNKFRLDDSFLANYKNRRPNFGFNGLGEFVYYRTYSRLKEDGSKETFLDTLQRVTEGCYEIQRIHCQNIHIPWDLSRAKESAEEMFDRMWNFKFLPPGRGLWMMGTDFMWNRGSAALNNCAMVSTDDEIEADPAEPFCFLMDMSLLGVGVGFDTKGAGKIRIQNPGDGETTFQIPDSREGWVDSVRRLIRSYTVEAGSGSVEFDYSLIRPAGSLIRGFGGKSSGPGILEELHDLIRVHLDRKIGGTLSSVDITEIMNYIGCCIVAGHVRRTAELALGATTDIAYCNMKNPIATLLDSEVAQFTRIINKLHTEKRNRATLDDFRENSIFEGTLFSEQDLIIPRERLIPAIETWNALQHHRWASNNSVFAEIGMDYSQIGSAIAVNGEPGLAWLNNMRDFGRMIDGRQPGIDGRVTGCNPCVEQSLESYELCCLVETFPANHDNADDYMRTLKFAYLYGKTVTLLPTHNPRTNAVMLRNRRIGLSQSGIVQAFAQFGRRAVLADFCDAGYNEIRRWDDIYSEWLCVQRSIKVTSVKPSGTVSLLANATPGIHHPEASTYWRRVRIAKDSVLVRILRDAGYHIEQAFSDPHTVVVTFAVSDERVRPVNEVTIWEQVKNAVDYQRYWSDNQVSATIKFQPDEADDIVRVLAAFEDQLKGISFLPHEDHGYSQPPYEPCTAEEAEQYNKNIKAADYSDYINEATGSRFCENDTCSLVGDT